MDHLFGKLLCNRLGGHLIGRSITAETITINLMIHRNGVRQIMRKTSTNKVKGKKNRPKTKLGIPDLEHSKAAVLRSLGSPDSVRGYQHAIDEFVAWYCSEPRLAFNKTVVLRYRFHLEERGLAPGTINVEWRPCDGWLTRRLTADC